MEITRPKRSALTHPNPVVFVARLGIGLVFTAGALDLGLTLRELYGSGLLEANPIARAVMKHGLYATLAFKVVLMLTNAIPLWVWSERRFAQFAVAASLIVMLVLMTQWVRWYGFKADFGPEVLGGLSSDPRWVRFGIDETEHADVGVWP